MSVCENNRILIVDDNSSIHEDYRKILAHRTDETGMDELERELFGGNAARASPTAGGGFSLTCVFQGQEALEAVRHSLLAHEPFAVAFVDMRMPPGWDGVETIRQLWEVDPDLQVVICSAYSDYSWPQIVAALGDTDRLLILKKPFEIVEVMQCASAMAQKWRAQYEARALVQCLDHKVHERTIELEQAMQCMQAEVHERERIADELRLAQKLESVGRLAAGIAHEINTPIQYVGDSVHFVRSVHDDIQKALDAYRSALESAAEGADAKLLWQQLQESDRTAELRLLQEEIPGAYRRAFEGVERVVDIVRAMKEFAHPGQGEQGLADINHAINTTLAVARSEYKYVATVCTELGELPEVRCNVGELNQVLLNLIVNAAHAIADAGHDPRTGRIRIATRLAEAGWLQIEIGDNGCGIAAPDLEKIYDPYFTTKALGRGSGQGLAIARSIIVDKHGGRIRAQSEVGVGTSFYIQLPVKGVATPMKPHAVDHAPADDCLFHDDARGDTGGG